MKGKSPDSSQTSFLTVPSVFGLQAYYWNIDLSAWLN